MKAVSNAIGERMFLPFYKTTSKGIVAQIARPYQLDDQNAAVWLDRLTVPLSLQLREDP